MGVPKDQAGDEGPQSHSLSETRRLIAEEVVIAGPGRFLNQFGL